MRVPDGWSSLQITEILERVSDPVFPEPEENYYQIGIRSHGKGLFHKEPVTGEALGNKRVFRVHPNCFIVNIVFAWEQAIAKTSDNEIGKIASHRFPMFRPKNNLCDVDYMTYFFKAPKGKYLLGLASPGGAGRNKTLGQSEFSLLRITLPPTKEQQKIAQIISTCDKAIAKLEALIAAKQKRKKALMQQLLTGKMRFSGFEGEWITCYLGDICTLKGGCAFNETYQGEIEGEIPFIKVSDMNLYNNSVFINDANNWISTQVAEKIKAKPFPKGAIVFAKVGAALLLNRRRVLMRETIIDNNMMAAIPNKSSQTSFLYQLMLMIDFAKIVQEGAVPSVNQSELARLKVKVPEIKEQQKIATVLSAADNEITTHQNQLAALKQQKTGLMQQLLTGKKRVQVGEIAIG